MAKKKKTPTDTDAKNGHTILPFPNREDSSECDSFDDTPEFLAELLIQEAYETSSKRKRVSLAKQALEIYPFCADAFGILAQFEAKYAEDALDYFTRGYLVARIALGNDIFENGAGHFWEIFETRPFMRAYAGMAECYVELGMHEQAIASYHDILRLCTGDNMGIRYILLPYLLDLKRYKDAEEVYKKYKRDHSAWWFYSRALLDFVKAPEGETALQSLHLALDYNPYIPPLLAGHKPMPAELPFRYAPSGEDEAILYVEKGLSGWQNAPGALQWLKKAVNGK